MTKKTLMALVDEYNALTAAIVAAEGELTPEIEKSLSFVETALPEKVDGYAMMLERLEIEEGYWKGKADLYIKIARAHAKARERLKDALKFAVESLGLDEIYGNDVRFKLVNAKPALKIIEAKLPADFFMVVTERVPDKEKIRLALSEGFDVAGATLEPSKSLRAYANKKEK